MRATQTSNKMAARHECGVDGAVEANHARLLVPFRLLHRRFSLSVHARVVYKELACLAGVSETQGPVAICGCLCHHFIEEAPFVLSHLQDATMRTYEVSIERVERYGLLA